MARSSKKGPFIDGYLQKKVDVSRAAKDNKPIKTWSRRSTVTPAMVGLNFLVHNGRDFMPVYITENHVGYKLGEFVPTRTFRGHKGSVQKKVGK